MKVGFTGTRDGMTMFQKEQFVIKIIELLPTEFHHGDCVGADAEAHDIVNEFFPHVMIHVYPPKDAYNRAYKNGHTQYPEEEYLQRDKNIVNNTEYLIGAPKSMSNITRSGTWYTIRYAQKILRSHYILIR